MSISALRPPCTPRNPIETIAPRGVRHCTMCLHCTKRLPGRGAGTALAVTEGLRQAKSCELIYNPSVNSLSLIATSPFRAGFWVGDCTNQKAPSLREFVHRLRG